MNATRLRIVLASLLAMPASLLAAPVNYDETIDGDIVSSNPVTTLVKFNLDVGTNTIKGNLGAFFYTDPSTGVTTPDSQTDLDWFKFEVPADTVLASFDIAWSNARITGTPGIGGMGITSCRLFNESLTEVIANASPAPGSFRCVELTIDPAGSRTLFTEVMPLPARTYVWQHGGGGSGGFGLWGFDIDYELTLVVMGLSAEQQLNTLVETVVSMNIQSGIGNALDGKLQSALDALDRAQAGDTASAAGILYAFIQSVEAQRGKKLSHEQSDQLVAAATAIIEVLIAP